MKKFLVFAGHNFYPSGGMEDLIVQLETVDEVKIYVKGNFAYWDWLHVYNVETETRHSESEFLK